MTASPPTASALRAFAEAFFAQFEARVESLPDELVVELPPRLADHFGKPRLYLAFPTAGGAGRDLSPHEDLLVYGSRTFDLMLALLDGQGEVARLEFPRQVSLALEAAPGPSLRQPQFAVTELAVDRREAWYRLFNFRVTYRSDEKEEAFDTVALDAAGQPAPAVEALLRRLAPLPRPPAPPAGHFAPSPEAAAEEIRRRARQHAEALQQQIQARLARVQLRLTGFYRRLMAEAGRDQPEPDERLVADLEQELERKIADELERHQLHIQVTPLSTALALLPTVHVRLSVATGAAGHVAAPVAALPAEAVAALAGLSLRHERYRWQRVAAADYSVYIGHHWLWGVVVLALDYAGQLLHWQKASALGKLQGAGANK